MNETENVVETVDLARDFGGHIALRDISLSLAKGDVLALLGPNGVGKSTLMKLMAGLLMPSRGSVRLWGQPSWPASAVACRVGCLLEGEPPGDVRVRDLLALRNSVTRNFDRATAEADCARHGVDLASHWRSLSKGQRRWVLLACLLASGAELLLLDEPADGLDVATRRELYGRLRNLANERGVTIALASHIIADVERIADDVLILADGRVRLHSPLEQLRDEVFEIEVRGEFPVGMISQVAEIISERRVDDVSLYVVRFRSLNLAEQTLLGEVGRRRLGLEDLFLAYTEPSPGRRVPDVSIV